MRLILLFLLIGLSGASGVHAKEAVSAQSQPQTILVIGDSLSAAYGLDEADGWVSLAEATLQEQYPDINIVNASISGDTTEGAVRRLPMALERFEPDILIIELGGNDGLRGYPLKKMTENLQSLAEMGNQAGASVLILGMRIPSNYGPVYTEKFAEAFAEAAKASDAELVPFFLEPIALDASFFQRDGIHPNAEAQPLILEPVLDKLQVMLESIVEK